MKSKRRNGFTLVELLAVIVILAIIMIIAIPSVLDTLTTARKKTFLEYIDKVAASTQTKYAEDTLKGEVSSSSNVMYDIKKDLGFSSTGGFEGYSLITAEKEIYITLHNEEYSVYGVKWGNVDISDLESTSLIEEELLSRDNLAKSVGVSNYLYRENGIYNQGEVSITKAILTDGASLNKLMKKLANEPDIGLDEYDYAIKHVVFTKNLNDAPSSKQVVSASNSEELIYLWWDNSTKTIYLGCKNNMIYLNKDPSKLFNRMRAVEDIDSDHFLSDDAESLYRFFGECLELKEAKVSHFKTSKVKNFRGLFLNLRKVKTIDVSHFDTSSATKMGYMFNDLPLVTNLDLSNFNTSNVTDMEFLITNTAITELHLESFDTHAVNNMQYMFANNTKLTKIYVSNKFVTTSVTNGIAMFSNSKQLPNYSSSELSSAYVSKYVTVV